MANTIQVKRGTGAASSSHEPAVGEPCFDTGTGKLYISGSAGTALSALTAINAGTASSLAADNLTAGDAAINLTTTAGNITIDAQGSDTDIIMKGTDDAADTTYLTLDGSAAGHATFNNKVTATGFVIGSADIAEAELEILDGASLSTTELNYLDGTVLGTAVASKALAVDSNKDLGTLRNLTIDGTFSDGNYTFDTSGNVSGLGTVGCGVVTQGGATLAATYSPIAGGTGILTTGALGTGSISSGFGNIDNGSSTLDTGAVSCASISVEEGNITNVGDINCDSISVDAAAAGLNIDFSGANTGTSALTIADNLAEALVITQGGNDYLDIATANGSETVHIGHGVSGTAVTIGHGTSETTIGDNLTVTGDLTVSGDTVTVNAATLDVEDLNITVAKAATTSSATNGAGLTFGAWSSGTIPTLTWDHGNTRFAMNKDLATDIVGDVTGDLTGNASGTALTVTQAAQTSITSVGTLTSLAVDNITINGNDISSTAGTDLTITPLTGQQIVLDGTIIIDAGVVTGATSITSTAFVGALTGNASGTAATVTGGTQASITTCANLVSIGTITTGTWTGTKVASAYLDDDTAHLTTAQTFSGAKTFTGNVVHGVDGTGVDVSFFGDTASALMLWDQSADNLVFSGGANVDGLALDGGSF